MKGFGAFRFKRKIAAVWLSILFLCVSWIGWSLPNASYYALHGNTTACGDVLTAEDWTAAHKTLPCGQKITVCYTNGCARGVVITDRGPYVHGRELDLNMTVADRIGLTADGVGSVTWWETGYDPHYYAK